MNDTLKKWHTGKKINEMKKLREDALKTMTRDDFRKKEIENFAKVRDFLKESGNRMAYNRCYKMPWVFYGVYDFGKCVEILIAESAVSERKDGEQ